MLTVKSLLLNMFIVFICSFFNISRNQFVHLLCFSGSVQSSGENKGSHQPRDSNILPWNIDSPWVSGWVSVCTWLSKVLSTLLFLISCHNYSLSPQPMPLPCSPHSVAQLITCKPIVLGWQCTPDAHSKVLVNPGNVRAKYIPSGGNLTILDHPFIHSTNIYATPASCQ